MDRLVRHFFQNTAEHPSDERIARYVGKDMPRMERWLLRRHIADCAACRQRRDQLESARAERILFLYRELAEQVDLRLPDRPRAAFASWLELQLRRPAARSQERRPSARSFQSRLPVPRLVASAALVLGVAIVAGSLTWGWMHRTPPITANALLVRAETWDAAKAGTSPGVVRQTVRITTPGETLDRAVYRDIRGKRRPRHEVLPPREEHLRWEFEQAGIAWEQPISASSYQAWHDHQHVRADRITSKAHLLTLTTTVPDGLVSEESLTVRDSDFHPVERTVNFRGQETVEIAEVDFRVLPWSDVDAGIFEPLNPVLRTAGPLSPRIVPPLRVPQPPRAEDLDETELTARLILNQLHADTGEQIEITRTPDAIVVQGLVETDQRKHELMQQLLSVPHLRASLESVADLRRAPAPGNEAVSVEGVELPDQPSPLEGYLRPRGHSTEDINGQEQQLFSAALAISQETKAIVELNARFHAMKPASLVASATLTELLYSHHERLLAAIEQERALLAAWQLCPTQSGNRDISQLTDIAAANLALSKELTQTNRSENRDAAVICVDLSSAMNHLSAAARAAYTATQSQSAMDGER